MLFSLSPLLSEVITHELSCQNSSLKVLFKCFQAQREAERQRGGREGNESVLESCQVFFCLHFSFFCGSWKLLRCLTYIRWYFFFQPFHQKLRNSYAFRRNKKATLTSFTLGHLCVGATVSQVNKAALLWFLVCIERLDRMGRITLMSLAVPLGHCEVFHLQQYFYLLHVKPAAAGPVPLSQQRCFRVVPHIPGLSISRWRDEENSSNTGHSRL